MSLLFLTSMLEGFQALDEVGRPIPHATLAFFNSGTTVRAPIYADQELETELDNPLTADELGRFPLIYLPDDGRPLRVMLHTGPPPFELMPEPNPKRRRWDARGGRLRWDIDPYLCDCTEPPYLFRGPVHQALRDGRTVPGAKLRFTLPGSDTPTDVYGGPGPQPMRRPALPNPLRANAGGFFPPVYLDDDAELRVRLETPSGDVLLDLDPYVCSCGFLLRTSRPYALETMDALAPDAAASRGYFQPSWLDAMEVGAAAVEGSLREPLVAYVWPAEALDSAAAPVAGEMRTPLVSYSLSVEAIDSQAAATSGTLRVALVRYQNWPIEALDTSATVLSGALT